MKSGTATDSLDRIGRGGVALVEMRAGRRGAEIGPPAEKPIMPIRSGAIFHPAARMADRADCPLCILQPEPDGRNLAPDGGYRHEPDATWPSPNEFTNHPWRIRRPSWLGGHAAGTPPPRTDSADGSCRRHISRHSADSGHADINGRTVRPCRQRVVSHLAPQSGTGFGARASSTCPPPARSYRGMAEDQQQQRRQNESACRQTPRAYDYRVDMAYLLYHKSLVYNTVIDLQGGHMSMDAQIA